MMMIVLFIVLSRNKQKKPSEGTDSWERDVTKFQGYTRLAV